MGGSVSIPLGESDGVTEKVGLRGCGMTYVLVSKESAIGNTNNRKTSTTLRVKVG